MTNSRAPFWEALVAYHAKGVIPFHTPGHKLRSGPFANVEAVLGSGFYALDPSDEVENLELKHDFRVVLAEAEKLAAELFGSRMSLFLVNGTTCGLHYLLMPTTGTVLVPRFSHQAVYSGMMLSMGQVRYLPTAYDPDWLIPLPPDVAQVEVAVADTDVEAFVLTNPTYYGTVGDIEALIGQAKARGILIFVDEAHGGHFGFSDKLPVSALECGADAVVQSTHKTLGSFTQTSMLHANNAFWFEKVVQAQNVLQTTSPSLVFLAVLDEVRRVLSVQGRDLVGQTLDLAMECRRQLGSIPGVELLPNHLQADPTKVVFSLRELGLTGIEVERILRLEYNIQVELSDYYNVLALATIGDTMGSIKTLVSAISDLAKRRKHVGSRPLERHRLDFPPLPPIVASLREAFFTEKTAIDLESAQGEISGGFLTPYPPGVPVIAPGEEFTPDIIEHLLWCLKMNWHVRGLMPGQRVAILKDNCRFCRKTR